MTRTACAALVAILLAGAAAADPLLGRWQTAPDDNGNVGIIEVAPCAAALCGTLIAAFDPSGAQIDSTNVGRQIIWDTVASGDGEYRGRIYAPDRDKEYNSRLRLAGDRLTVSGCVMGICREGGTWVRVQ
jgi:uncharacterized protein (DUF2147 family)